MEKHLTGCGECGYVPVNNQGRCAEHQQKGDTIGPTLYMNKQSADYLRKNLFGIGRKVKSFNDRQSK